MALACEAAGFFYVGVCDHTFIPERLAGAMSTTWYDTVATLGWLAGVTTEIRLLSHIYVVALRHPLRAAKEFATARRAVPRPGDLRRGRRARHRGVRPAWGRRSTTGGRPPTRPSSAWPPGWSTSSPSWTGHAGRRRAWASRPRPVQSPRPPIWVGGSSPAALRRTARFADGWLPQSLGPNLELLAELRGCATEYRGGAPLDIGAIADPLYVGAPPAGLELPPGTVAGPPEQIAEYLRPFTDGRRGPGPGPVPVPLGRGAVRPDRRLRRRGASRSSTAGPAVRVDATARGPVR